MNAIQGYAVAASGRQPKLEETRDERERIAAADSRVDEKSSTSPQKGDDRRESVVLSA